MRSFINYESCLRTQPHGGEVQNSSMGQGNSRESLVYLPALKEHIERWLAAAMARRYGTSLGELGQSLISTEAPCWHPMVRSHIYLFCLIILGWARNPK